jgi:hypothetical protein
MTQKRATNPSFGPKFTRSFSKIEGKNNKNDF